jgi:hypothetical protein
MKEPLCRADVWQNGALGSSVDDSKACPFHDLLFPDGSLRSFLKGSLYSLSRVLDKQKIKKN